MSVLADHLSKGKHLPDDIRVCMSVRACVGLLQLGLESPG